MVSAGAVYLHRIGALNVRTPHANIVCQKDSDDRPVWHIVQFEASPYAPYYSKGPTDRPHGFPKDLFMVEKWDILHAREGAWTITKRKLESDAVLELLGDLLDI